MIACRSDSRIAIYLNHSLWVPESAGDIVFNSRRNFLCIDGDGSIVYFTVPRGDFESFISRQLWCNHCYGQGPYILFPDSLLNHYPMNGAECKAPKGDVLLVYADTLPGHRLRVGLYTDWN